MRETEYDIMRQVEDRHWWYAALRSMVARDVVAQPSPGAKLEILDAGCGTGGMLRWLREAGGAWELSGVDISPHAVEICHDRGFKEVRQGSVCKLPLAAASKDIVLSLDVLYHDGVDPQAAIAEMKRVLKPGGTLLINLAAFDVLRGNHDEAVHGARRFTPASVRQLLKDNCLEIEKLHCWNAWLFPPLLFMRMLSRFSSRAGAPPTCGDLTSIAPTLNAVLTGIARVDTMATRLLHCPIGTSVYAIARKPAA